MLRLWAEVYRVRLDSQQEETPDSPDGDVDSEVSQGWEQMSEDIVPVNLLCLQSSPDLIFQVFALDRLGRCAIDTRIFQPGILFASIPIQYF